MSIANKILSTIKKIIPQSLLKIIRKPYHFILSAAAAVYYSFPSEKMIIIGVTGTSGKTTAIEMISKVLEGAGHQVGYTSTAKWKVRDKEILNNKKMTMLGRFQTQKLLSKMFKAGCQYGIIETTSEGIEQFRDVGIHYDIIAITNLYSEHIEAHGSFENYKEAKMKLFRKLEWAKHKKLKVKNEKFNVIKKVVIANFDDEHCQSFIQFSADEKYLFGINNKADLTNSIEIRAQNIRLSAAGMEFSVQAVPFKLNILGQHNIYNALIAVCVGVSQGMKLPEIAKSLEEIKKIDGRLERIDEGQNFTVIVDYAFEPKAVAGLYETIKKFNLSGVGKKIIHVLGATGGGRDKNRRPILGKIAAENADVIIITNEDPYDEGPMQIIEDVANGIKSQKSKVKSLFKILDRQEAIRKALNLAGEGDLVLITGKGCEQAIAVADGELIPWDDRVIVRKEIKSIL